MRGRRVHRVGAHHLHTDDELAKLRIVERGDVQPAIGACHEDIARAVVRPGAGHHLGAARDARPDVADVRLQRVPDIAAPLRPPRIVDGRAEILRNQPYDLVLETAAGLVREREIVGIGADAKRGGISGSGADHHGRRRYDDAETPAPLHGLTLVSGAAVCDAEEGAGTDSDFTYAARSQICCRLQAQTARMACRSDGPVRWTHRSAPSVRRSANGRTSVPGPCRRRR